MGDIKTRDALKGTIKTLDRAAGSMHRMKDTAIRIKSSEIGRDSDEESGSSYALGKAGSYAGSGASYAMQAGMELAVHQRSKAARQGAEITAEEIMPSDSDRASYAAGQGRKLAMENHQKLSKGETPSAGRDQKVQEAFRELNIKTVKSRRMKEKMAEAEVTANAGERKGNIIRGRKVSAAGKGQKPLKAAGSSAEVLQRQKEYGRRKLIRKKMQRKGFRFFGTGGRKTAEAGFRMGRTAVRSTGAFLKALSAGGMLSVTIIIVMVLFGAALLFNEDGSYITGTGDDAIVEVARGELGNKGGAKYWKWYGFKSRVDWCAIFCSWCADQCGYIRAGTLPKFALVSDGASWFKSRHRWSGRGYTPKPGDFIFFDYEQDGVLDHVGIVESCDGKRITTIEGNSSDACKRNSYVKGSLMIAGYGLSVKTGGNKAKLIAMWAMQLSYPDDRKEAKYHGGKPTAAYKAALEMAYPDRGSWGKPSRDGASCDVFVGVCIVDSGVDKDFPRGYRDQAIRLDKRTDLYDCVISTTSRNIRESELKDGDIIRYVRNDGGVHIFIYAGGMLRHAALNSWYPRTTTPQGRFSISGKKFIKVYRVKEK